MNLQTILDAARALGPVLASVPAIVELVDNAVSALSEPDQVKAKAALAELRQENDDLHARLQAKLTAAAGQG